MQRKRLNPARQLLDFGATEYPYVGHLLFIFFRTTVGRPLDRVLPAYNFQLLTPIRHFIVEDVHRQTLSEKRRPHVRSRCLYVLRTQSAHFARNPERISFTASGRARRGPAVGSRLSGHRRSRCRYRVHRTGKGIQGRAAGRPFPPSCWP